MNISCLINCLSYLDINELIRLFYYKKEYLNYYVEDIIKKNFRINKKIENINLTNFINIIPLPSYLKYNVFGLNLLKNNYYKSDGKIFNNIMQSNVCLPHPSISPIPFTYGFIKKNKYNLISSNVYYFEVKINDDNYNYYSNFLISVGFGSVRNHIINCHVGNQDNSIGLNSENGEVFINNSKYGIKICNKIGLGSTIGAGLIYTKNEYYIPFFTLNGKLLDDLRETILNGLLTPQISYRNISGFKVNFGQEKFLFNIEKFIKLHNNDVLSTKNYFLIKNFDVKLYKFVSVRVKKNIKKDFKPLYIPLPTTNIIFNPFSNNENITNLISPINENNNSYNYDESIELEEEVEEIIEESYNTENLLQYSDNITSFFENINL